MKTYAVQVKVKFKDGILDPQAEATQSALERLGYRAIDKVEVDKLFMIHLKAENEDQAKTLANEMSVKLLANPVMEDFEVSLTS